MALQSAITGAAATASALGTYGASWWQNTACSYSFVQTYIGYCPSICDKFPAALVGMCETVLPYAQMIGTENLVYGSLALTTAAAAGYTAWRVSYPQQVTVHNHLHLNVDPKIFAQIEKQLQAIQEQITALSEKMQTNTLTVEEQVEEVSLIQRARAQLEAYLKQEGCGGEVEYIGDKIREMGLELLEKRLKKQPLVKDRETIDQNEEDRIQGVLASKEAERQQRLEARKVKDAQTLAKLEARKKKSPAFQLHVNKTTPAKADPAVIEPRKALLQEIQSAGSRKTAAAGI